MWTVLLITLVFFFFIMMIMGVGYLTSGRCLRGSCGGVVGEDGQMSCPTCGKGQDDSAANESR